MRVKCISSRLADKEYRDLTVGNLYEVLGVSGGDYRVMSDFGRPYLYPDRLFVVVDPAFPEGWVVATDDEGEFRASPKEFAGPGFWEDYFENVGYAVLAVRLFFNKRLRGE